MVCVRGASALGELLARYPEASVRLQVVWVPVVETDHGPPEPSVTAPLDDPRVTWYWDKDRILSPLMAARMMQLYREGHPVPQIDSGDIVWDVIASFAPATSWEEPFPTPTWFGMDAVLTVLPDVERQLRLVSNPAASP